MRIDVLHARKMLAGMDYDCEMLNCLAEVPESAIWAVHSAWQSMQHGKLEHWEIELVTAKLLEALAQVAQEDVRNNCHKNAFAT